MKKTYLLKWIIFIAVYLFSSTSASQANWLKSEENLNSQQTQFTPNTQYAPHSSDSLPSGVTKEWLNKLTDERGNRIIPEEEDPEGDALQQKTFDGVVAGDEYGRSVSSAGDVNGDGFDDVIIGAPKNNAGGIKSGRAYIYFGGTVLNTAVDVILTGAAANYYFGTSVAGAGDVNSDGYDDVIVGAYGYSTFRGRAYIYYGGASMNSTADVTMTGESAQNNFGYSVSGAGDVNNDGFSDVIIGAYAKNAYTGKGYIYYGGVLMNNIADVTMNGESGSNNFGYSVSGAGDVNGDGYHDVIIGAYGYNADVGKAYIYFGGASMDNIADVNMFGGAIFDFFGASVSNAGDVNDDGYSDVIVGAYGYNSITGRAYIYYGGISMDAFADVTMTGEATNNQFGYSVSDAGDVNGDGFADVYVGAWGFSTSKGRAYLYYGGVSMNNVVDIYMTGDTTLNYFGYSVSGGCDVNGDGFSDMISGAFGKNSNTGRAYVYTNTLSGEDLSDLEMHGEAQDDQFGISVSSAGDVNNDGYDDIIIGAYGYNDYTGRAYIFYGGIIPDNIPDVIFTGESTSSAFGRSVSSAGDVNGDGFDEVIIGANGTSSNNGRAYIYFGGTVMNNVPDVIFLGNTNDWLGWSVSSAGDVNDDGFSDVILGGLKAYICFGSVNMDNVADVIMTRESAGSWFGTTVSSAGDFNNDGFSDVIVGDFGYDSFSGRAYLFYGGAIMNNVPDVIFTGNTFEHFGWSVSGAGDVNGDGYSDVIVGANKIYRMTAPGSAYIYFGGNSPNNISDVIFTGGNWFGVSVSGFGDVNGDEFSDIFIGADYYNANIYFGGATVDNVTDITLKNQLFSFFGHSGSIAGDFNGDGFDDAVVGAYRLDNDKGGAYIYLSSPPDNRKNLFLFGAIQGMYDPVLNTEVPDTIKVFLRNSTSPYTRVDSSKNILLGPGTGQLFLFRNVQNGRPYFIEVTHRNALTTWSANPVTFVNSDASIAFSVDAIYAYGNNEIQVDASPYNVFAFYSGDVNHDGSIETLDLGLTDNDAFNFVTGYVNTDVTGNNVVDAADLLIIDNNAFNFVSKITPP